MSSIVQNIPFRQLFHIYRSQFLWISFGLLSLLLSRILGLFPGFVEYIYSRGLFQGIRILGDYTMGLLPFPLLYLAIILVLLWGILRWKKRKQIKTSFLNKAFRLLLNILALGLGIVGMFFWLWGFNYSRIPIEKQLELEKVKPDKTALIDEIDKTVQKLDSLRKQIPSSDTTALTALHLPQKLESRVRTDLEALLSEINYPTPGRVRGRKILPKGWLIGLGASGIYIPFVGEGHFDGALHPIQHPSVLAHEMSHGYGFTDEGVCNFLALLACERATEPFIQYSGSLMYFRYLIHDLFRMDPAYYRKLIPNLPSGIQADLEAIKKNQQQYQPWFPAFSQKVYNSYLQSQGVKEGIQSYNRVVGLYAAWKKRKKKK